MVLFILIVLFVFSFLSILFNILFDVLVNSEKFKVIRKIRVFVFIVDD